MNNELKELLENREEAKKQALMECEEVAKIAAEFNEIIKKAEEKLNEFKSVVLRRTNIFVEKYEEQDEAPLVRVMDRHKINEAMARINVVKEQVWEDLENAIAIQYVARGFILANCLDDTATIPIKIKNGRRPLYFFANKNFEEAGRYRYYFEHEDLEIQYLSKEEIEVMSKEMILKSGLSNHYLEYMKKNMDKKIEKCREIDIKNKIYGYRVLCTK